jgi:AcrR family transcriptional regulator
MSPQVSNRDALLEGALQCLEELGYGEVTTRDIAQAAKANVASITYHFGSKDALIAEALAEGFRRWLAEFTSEVTRTGAANREARLQSAVRALGESIKSHAGMARAFIAALSRAPHDEHLRDLLGASYRETRTSIAAFLELGEGEQGELLAGILIAMFDGLLIQWLIDPEQGTRDLAQLPSLLGTLSITSEADHACGDPLPTLT